MESIRTLLGGLVDYAGLFPPAKLDMATAVRNYAQYRDGPDAWALGRFIVPVSRLDEFTETAAQILPRDGRADPWRISVLAGADPSLDAAAIVRFNQLHNDAPAGGGARIDTVEARAATNADIQRIADTLTAGVITYVEIPIDRDPVPLVVKLAEMALRAKVRTGGVTAEAFPPAGALARFIAACVKSEVPFKATAGLHHPLRANYRLTYEPDSPSGTMFGFLNVFLAAGFASEGLPLSELPAVLEETSPTAFAFDDRGVTWRDRRLELDRLRRLRNRVAVAFGSCSFDEPVGDMRQLGLL